MEVIDFVFEEVDIVDLVTPEGLLLSQVGDPVVVIDSTSNLFKINGLLDVTAEVIHFAVIVVSVINVGDALVEVKHLLDVESLSLIGHAEGNLLLVSSSIDILGEGDVVKRFKGLSGRVVLVEFHGISEALRQVDSGGGLGGIGRVGGQVEGSLVASLDHIEGSSVGVSIDHGNRGGGKHRFHLN